MATYRDRARSKKRARQWDTPQHPCAHHIAQESKVVKSTYGLSDWQTCDATHLLFESPTFPGKTQGPRTMPAGTRIQSKARTSYRSRARILPEGTGRTPRHVSFSRPKIISKFARPSFAHTPSRRFRSTEAVTDAHGLPSEHARDEPRRCVQHQRHHGRRRRKPRDRTITAQ